MTDLLGDAAALEAIGAESEAVRRARLVTVLLRVCIAVTVVLVILLPKTPRILIPLTLFAAMIAAVWVILRMGHTRVASTVVLSVPFLLIASFTHLDGGVRGIAFSPLFSIVMLAGILLGRRATIVATVCTLALGTGLVVAESAGVLVRPIASSSLDYFVVYAVGLVMCAAIVTLSLRAAESALKRLRTNELELATRNHSLEEHAREAEQRGVALKSALRAYQILSDCNRTLVHAECESDLTQDVCRVLVEDEHYGLAWIALTDEEESNRLLLAAEAGPYAGRSGTAQAVQTTRFDGLGPVATAWRNRAITLVDDIADKPEGESWRDAALAHGFRSCIVLPLHSGECLLGLLSIYSSGSEAFDSEEVGLLRELADDVAFGLTSLRASAAARERDMLIWRSEERLHQATLVSQLGIFDNDHLAGTVYWSPELRAIHGFDADESTSLAKLVGSIHPDDQEDYVAGVRRAHDPSGDGCLDVETRVVRADGDVRWVATRSMTFFDGEEPGPLRTVGAVLDITESKQAGKRIERQLQRLDALHTIDMAISGNLNLKLTLGVIVDQITTSLEADAVSVLMLDPLTYVLEYAHGSGFGGQDVSRSRVPLGEGPAGTAALEQRTICIGELSSDEDHNPRTRLMRNEGIRSHIVTPLIVKGQTKGVLEIFHRRGFEPDEEWTGFLEALALQTAIALDSASMFEELERSNIELCLAYDATIEGWSRALDLRDRETEGHTQRVTEITMRLARAMGIDGEDAVHIRRGALLHDIGKMGVPDSILHKAGPLTDDEWVVMHQHPQLAFEMLAPIAHLRPALDIPSCHHEKWDGTGYPRGLKGELIPRAARIFAVVDVWDALCSDRPYRAAWHPDDARNHIVESSGTHLDPQVVTAFIKMLDGA